ncbi:hypothetical protein HDK90DRAFT_162281 [Phyllosticta capitalensis]|uniref:Uncharacterized protein n=1 Tax=Phyllosticta capitalensis TaxID=121624 RepID=A0ABR1Z1S1_9PEZI
MTAPAWIHQVAMPVSMPSSVLATEGRTTCCFTLPLPVLLPTKRQRSGDEAARLLANLWLCCVYVVIATAPLAALSERMRREWKAEAVAAVNPPARRPLRVRRQERAPSRVRRNETSQVQIAGQGRDVRVGHATDVSTQDSAAIAAAGFKRRHVQLASWLAAGCRSGRSGRSRKEAECKGEKREGREEREGSTIGGYLVGIRQNPKRQREKKKKKKKKNKQREKGRRFSKGHGSKCPWGGVAGDQRALAQGFWNRPGDDAKGAGLAPACCNSLLVACGG